MAQPETQIGAALAIKIARPRKTTLKPAQRAVTTLAEARQRRLTLRMETAPQLTPEHQIAVPSLCVAPVPKPPRRG